VQEALKAEGLVK